MRSPCGGALCGLYHVTSRREAVARAYREFPGCTLVPEWTCDEDQMSPNELDQCREELGLRPLHSRAPQRPTDWSALDLY